MTRSLWETAVAVAGRPIEAVAVAVDGAGAWSWGWAVVVVAAGWRLVLLPVLVGQGRRRILTARWLSVHSRGRDMRDPRQRSEVRALTAGSLPGPTGSTRWAGRLVALVQVVVIVMVAVWSRGSETAAAHGFVGLPRLDATTATLGAGGVLWAAGLGMLFLLGATVTHHAAGSPARHQVVIDRVLTPVFFTALALALPAAVTVAFAASLAVGVLGVVVATGGDLSSHREPAGQAA